MLPSQTNFQRARVQEVRRQAQAASLAARPKLLHLMGSETFRQALRHAVPEVANTSSIELLHLLRREIAASEVCTGLPAAPSHFPGFPTYWWDMTLEEGLTSDALLNQWAVRLVHNQSFAPPPGPNQYSWFDIQDDVETRLYGLKPFRERGEPSSMQEAAERAVYTLVNTMRSDACSPLYGDVTFVMSAATVPATIISAIDTGEYAALCNFSASQALSSPFSRLRDTSIALSEAKAAAPPSASAAPAEPALALGRRGARWPPYHSNCSAYNFSLGKLPGCQKPAA